MSLTDGEKDGQKAFARLRPLCTRLLEVSSTSPEERGIVLDALERVLTDIDPSGLQRCMDYVLLPVLLLLDGAVSSRTSSGKDRRAVETRMLLVPDRVAERVLSCVRIVLQRCTLETKEQMKMMLRKLTGAAMLSASEAAEEFRHGVVKCLKTLLANLKSCNNATCACQSVSVPPFEILKQTTWSVVEGSKVHNEIQTSMDETDICPMGLLQLESMAPVVGHLISLLFQIAEAEAGRGSAGSGKLRRDALSTLRLLILKVGSADALAYCLPGAVRGFSVVMRFTKAQVNSGFSTPIVHVSGAAGWPAVVEEAVRGMAEILAIVLGDNTFKSPDSVTTSTEHANLNDALDYLKDLSIELRKTDKDNLSTHETNEVEVKSSTSVDQENQTHESGKQDVTAEVPSFRLERSKKWLSETTLRVHTFLSETLPLLCAHQSAPVRLAVVEAATVMLIHCKSSLETSNSLLLECLLALACDDFKHVASAAQKYLRRLTGFRGFLWSNNSMGELVNDYVEQVKVITLPSSIMITLLSSLVEQLPKVIFSANTAMAVSHGRRLAAAMYFSGPEGVSSGLLGTPIDRQRFTAVFKQCLGFNSAFTGSLGKVTSNQISLYPYESKILPVGGTDSDCSGAKQENSTRGGPTHKPQSNEIPSMPPWLHIGTGSQLYRVLADVLRLVGVSSISDRRNSTTLFGLVELLLEDVRLTASDQNMYNRSSKSIEFEIGQNQRAAATSACVLNEIIYGASGEWNQKLYDLFREQNSFEVLEESIIEMTPSNDSNSDNVQSAKRTNLVEENAAKLESKESCDVHPLNRQWEGTKKYFVRKALNECAGGIINDYLSTQIWDEPTDISESSPTSRILSSPNKHQDFFMLQKVLVEGLGVLGIALGKEFEESGLLRLALFPLLEKLTSPNHYVSEAAARSLNVICCKCQYPTVKDLVVANLDNVVDFLCRQFRHLNMHPHSLNLLAAILRFTNTAPDLLPLLGEPLHCVVMELDVMARTSRPHLTVPLLRAMREILRAARKEVDATLSEVMTVAAHWSSLTKVERDTEESAAGIIHCKDAGKIFEDFEMEEHVDGFLDKIRQRRAVAKVATSCLVACGPLLTSMNPQTCLLTLDVVVDGISTLADAEDACRYEETWREGLKAYCTRMHDIELSMRCMDAIKKDESETNKLLPTMHRIWPYFVACLKEGPISVIDRSLEVLALVMTKCGGEFFTRRLKNDVLPSLVGILSQGLSASPIKRRSYPLIPLEHTQPSEQGPTGLLKTQHAVLKSISSIAADKKSASALRSCFQEIASWVVLLACQVEPLRTAATETALALSTIDSDFVWILVADMVAGGAPGELTHVSLPGFPDFSKILPAWSSQKDSLWCQYTSYRGEFTDMSRDSAQLLLAKLEGVPTTRR